MSKEIWKDVPGYEGRYQVSNLGRFASIKKNHRIIRKISKFSTGYLCVSLDGKAKLLHRLVALSFISNPENKPQINHKNGVKADNTVDNLEWCTRSENCFHRDRELGVERVNKKKVVCIENGFVFDSAVDAARWLTGEKNRPMCVISKAYKIGACCRKEKGRKTCGGFKWNFI